MALPAEHRSAVQEPRVSVSSLIWDLRCPILGGASDEELARDHDLTPEAVAAVRKRLLRDVLTAEVMAAAQYLAELRGWGESCEDVIMNALAHAIIAETAKD